MNVKTKNKPLTDAQIYTLRRMNSGTKYMMQGNGKKGFECRPACRSAFGYDPINAPSVPVLYRMGLVEFTLDRGQEHMRFYNVQLTDAGREVAATLKVSTERTPEKA